MADGGLEQGDLEGSSGWEPGLTGVRMLDASKPDVIIEAGPNDYETGGPGLEHLSWSVDRGLDAIMVSKSALALHGERLLEAARRSGSRVFASGASAAAMPAVDFLTYDLAGSDVMELRAVLTGTTSYVLGAMVDGGLLLEEAVSEAVLRGIAEPDPSFDLDGWDTAAKLVIIAGMSVGVWLDLYSIPRDSVRSVSCDDAARWREAGETPALIGVLSRVGDSYEACVKLKTVPRDHPFALARGGVKALAVKATGFGEYTMLGGASSPDATVAAVLKDLEHLLALR